MAHGTENSSGSVTDSPIAGFAAKVSRYFLDFLETDFKKQQAPRRRIQLKNDVGFRTGLPLRKYPTLYASVWKMLSESIDEIQPLRIARGRFTATISPTLRDLIRQHVDSMDSSSFDLVRKTALDFAASHRAKAVENPERFVEEVVSSFVEAAGKHVVSPILALLDGPFRQQSYSAVESVYEVETDLVDALTVQVVEQLPAAINTFIISSALDPAQEILSKFFEEGESKERMKAFFEDFATADAYQELRDLTNYLKLGGENLQMYLYVCQLRFGTSAFPLFYIPVEVDLDASSGSLIVELEPRLYVHKRAIDYVVQEKASSAVKLALSPIDNRVIYLDKGRSFLDEIEPVLTKMSPTFDLAGPFDVRAPIMETMTSASLKLSKAAHFAVFDKSDESLLNDYEALLTAIHEDQKGVNDLFQDIIKGFLIDEPESVRERVSDGWDAMAIPDRLVAVSPIPLNDEQRKIISALNDPDCRFITVQGPPGTGKSHTITAIAFDCILNGKNVLILSDKKEALDVVEDKLKGALASVRPDADFPDPILRLGRTGSTYTRLISQSSQEKIRNHHRAAKTYNERLAAETDAENSMIREAISKTIDAYANVGLEEIETLHNLEHRIMALVPSLVTELQEPKGTMHLARLQSALTRLGDAAGVWEFFSQKFPSGSFGELLSLARVYAAAGKLESFRSRKAALSLFDSLGIRHQAALQRFILEYDRLRMPVFAYLFCKSKVRVINSKLGDELPCTNSLDVHKRLPDLRMVHECLVAMKNAVLEENLPENESEAIYRILARGGDLCPAADAFSSFLSLFRDVLSGKDERLSSLAVNGRAFNSAADLIRFVVDASRYALLWNKVGKTLASAPPFDYVGSKCKLEQLYTSRMTHEIDRRFLEFVEKSRATAKTLGGVIKAKQQFPQDAFEGLKEAFPCIIAGIREFAEYVPLKQELFDVIVIDEASQVSVAQAFPALLRAKKVVVLGDQKQFANVKSANASIALNQGYLTDLDQYFKVHVSRAADKIQRLKQFDVKNSILEFFDLVANYTDMLRKHFRGYQELISFSSKYFYGGQLQAIKVRGKPIEDVIEFSFVEPGEKPERYKNISTSEAEYILEKLREMVDAGETMSVGIITPFREQQQHLTKLIFADAHASQFEDQFRLKIMTFDTCQGEERDLIFYSMVATRTDDALNYVFPVSLDGIEERAEEALKIQRLNVGFSRAREKIHFVLSKPVEAYRGSIGRVLSHYASLLQEIGLPEEEETDPNSPMERKVLDWVTKTPFYQRNMEVIEIFAQFPVGDYLRQLDPTYQHPAYRCDFLVQYTGGTKPINIIIEYDGFQEHFIEHGKIHAGNYDAYYRPEDVERQMVLESYGYKFLRINRFNLGRDPVATLSDRLEALVKNTAREKEDPEVVTKIRDGANGLREGTVRHCRKCDQVKPKEAFFDPRLKGGQGGYGLICMECKAGANGQPKAKAPRKPIRRYWKRRW